MTTLRRLFDHWLAAPEIRSPTERPMYEYMIASPVVTAPATGSPSERRRELDENADHEPDRQPDQRCSRGSAARARGSVNSEKKSPFATVLCFTFANIVDSKVPTRSASSARPEPAADEVRGLPGEVLGQQVREDGAEGADGDDHHGAPAARLLVHHLADQGDRGAELSGEAEAREQSAPPSYWWMLVTNPFAMFASE